MQYYNYKDTLFLKCYYVKLLFWSVPDEVSRLQFEDISDRAVKVVWSPPESPNGVLTGYTLSYNVKDKPDSIKTENFTADTLSVMVPQLQVRLLKLLVSCLQSYKPEHWYSQCDSYKGTTALIYSIWLHETTMHLMMHWKVETPLKAYLNVRKKYWTVITDLFKWFVFQYF